MCFAVDDSCKKPTRLLLHLSIRQTSRTLSAFSLSPNSISSFALSGIKERKMEGVTTPTKKNRNMQPLYLSLPYHARAAEGGGGGATTTTAALSSDKTGRLHYRLDLITSSHAINRTLQLRRGGVILLTSNGVEAHHNYFHVSENTTSAAAAAPLRFNEGRDCLRGVLSLDESQLYVWDLRRRRIVCSSIPTGRQIAASPRINVRIWTLALGGGGGNSVRFLAAGTEQGTIIFFDPTSLQILAEVRAVNNVGEVRNMAVTVGDDNSTTIVAATGAGGTCVCLSVVTSKITTTLTTTIELINRWEQRVAQECVCVAIAPCGQVAVASGDSKALKFFRLSDGAKISETQGSAHPGQAALSVHFLSAHLVLVSDNSSILSFFDWTCDDSSQQRIQLDRCGFLVSVSPCKTRIVAGDHFSPLVRVFSLHW